MPEPAGRQHAVETTAGAVSGAAACGMVRDSVPKSMETGQAATMPSKAMREADERVLGGVGWRDGGRRRGAADGATGVEQKGSRVDERGVEAMADPL